jgi:NAD-dependent dihydropyrimidine dehydrogenase PreA subunit
MDVFRMDPETEQSKIVYPEDCQICHLCRVYCPVDGTITVTPVKGVKPMVGWA